MDDSIWGKDIRLHKRSFLTAAMKTDFYLVCLENRAYQFQKQSYVFSIILTHTMNINRSEQERNRMWWFRSCILHLHILESNRGIHTHTHNTHSITYICQWFGSHAGQSVVEDSLLQRVRVHLSRNHVQLSKIASSHLVSQQGFHLEQSMLSICLNVSTLFCNMELSCFLWMCETWVY